LQFHFNWKMLSAMAGVTWWNFYFRLFPGAIRSPQIIVFLAHLLRHIPGLNPVEYLWSYWKQHELPNFCPATFGQLSHHARRALRRMRQRPALVCAFWEQAELFPL